MYLGIYLRVDLTGTNVIVTWTLIATSLLGTSILVVGMTLTANVSVLRTKIPQ